MAGTKLERVKNDEVSKPMTDVKTSTTRCILINTEK